MLTCNNDRNLITCYNNSVAQTLNTLRHVPKNGLLQLRIVQLQPDGADLVLSSRHVDEWAGRARIPHIVYFILYFVWDNKHFIQKMRVIVIFKCYLWIRCQSSMRNWGDHYCLLHSRRRDPIRCLGQPINDNNNNNNNNNNKTSPLQSLIQCKILTVSPARILFDLVNCTDISIDAISMVSTNGFDAVFLARDLWFVFAILM